MLNWKEVPPPINTWVWAKYKLTDEPQLFLTCQRGCCVHTHRGCLTLPSYWKLATPEEGKAENLRWALAPKISDLYDLY